MTEDRLKEIRQALAETPVEDRSSEDNAIQELLDYIDQYMWLSLDKSQVDAVARHKIALLERDLKRALIDASDQARYAAQLLERLR